MKKIILIIVAIGLFSACASRPFRPDNRMTWGEIQEELKKRNIDIGNNHN